ncbi:histidine kinase [Cyclobacterium qasimii M12-11B]|uniref:histidine kinase n=1 Tax=Cyclobacterium qasimii M12-11B TaxID=641524 RepID=S7VBU2_9BACT|nr:histidine kinase dimerization/phospho-acceptor domain-containing protein [Cyclobacterium qasimii]EPR67680.1 histidine kinase [Cyclobacterium qasimii M12-11B]
MQKSKESNEIKSYFLSNISHELRTPLNAIIGLTQSIRETNKEESINSNLDVIQYSSLGLLGAIDDVLDYSKIEKGELRLEEMPFDLKKMVNQLAATFERQAKDKGLEFEFEEVGNLPELLIGDRRRMEQLFQNLLKNALKFTLKGKIDFKVEAIAMPDEQVLLKVQVTDTGVGIKRKNWKAFLHLLPKGRMMINENLED